MTDNNAPESGNTGRREFLQQLAALVAVGNLGLPASLARGGELPDAGQTMPAGMPSAPPGNLVGMQVGAHTMLDEGAERALDLMQEAAAVETVFVYSHSYGNNMRKPLTMLAKDHGVAPIDQQNRNLPFVWVRHHEEYFKDTSLRHQRVDASFAYNDRDLFAEMVKPLRARGMKVYARILEAGTRSIANFDKVVTVNVDGRPTGTACWSHPEYKEFWRATVADMFRSYELDGFHWGAERDSSLTNIIQNGSANSATCFCEYCRARGKANGIDVERARQGMAEVQKYVQGLRSGDIKAVNGKFTGYLRILFRFPEVLAWEYQYRQVREDVMKAMYETVKSIKPDAQVGWHVDHWATSMAIIPRAIMSYADMAPYSDFLKIVVYHAVYGPRISQWVTATNRSVTGDLSPDAALSLHYELFGYDKTLEPTHQQATATPAKGGSPEYVYRETRRSVASAEGKTRIYPGIGFDIGTGPARTPATAPDDAETIYQTVVKSYAAGASGVVASREYEEMTVPHMRGFGRAVRDVARGRG